jgi:predicted DCC family thiol-disulfide oxidoreductase YuxK
MTLLPKIFRALPRASQLSFRVSCANLQIVPQPMPVLLFDGECGLCNRVVRWLLRIDRRGQLYFTRLQSDSGQSYLRSRGLPTRDFDTVVLVPDWKDLNGEPPRFRTNGSLSALALVGGGWSTLAKLIRWVPAPIRDWVYKVIGHFRYRIFGPYKPKPLPNPNWANRFLP